MIREAAFAGSWYPGNANELNREMKNFFETHKLGPKKEPIVNEEGAREIISIISPHAGYFYSGAVAANGYCALADDGRPDLFIIIGINHHTYTVEPASVQTSGKWNTPLGQAIIDSEIAKKILKKDFIFDNSSIHRQEHSLELQLPFIQYVFGPDVNIVPIIISASNFKAFKVIGESVASAIVDKNVVIIASTDLTHFESAEDAKEQDQKAISAIKELDAELLFNTVKENAISMCGYGSTSAALIASKELGATKVELLKYANSGDTSGDYNNVVGYGSLIISK